jgi:NADH:ubiquinone oxidoreductase subunit 5 (subunit L)/multisubunit Na+/H+ antiporter MnhA subunit
MSKSQLLVMLCVLVPVAGSLSLPLVGKVSARGRDVLALLLALVSLGSALSLLPFVLEGGTETVAIAGVNLFQVDKLAVFMATTSMLIGSIIVFYSWGYMERCENQDEYYLMVVLFLGAMMGLVFSRSLIFLYGFWEITALACWRLIGFFREEEYVRRADKAFLVTVFGAVMMLAGFITVYAETGSFDLQALRGARLSDLAVGLMLLGILSKSATLPLHTWLADAGVAPSPVTALLHAAVLVKIGVYVFARLFIATFTIGELWHEVVPWIAAASALVSAGAALVATDMKRIIAYSTISQLAFIFLGLAVGSGVSVAGGLLYIFMHSIAKGGLFLCAGNVEHALHTKDITRMGGLARSMPITAAAFLMCALSVMGVPPFGGFFSKFLVIKGAFGAGQVALALTFVLGSVLTILYLFRCFTMIFLGEPRSEPHGHPVHEAPATMVASVAALAALALASGLFVKVPAGIVQSASQELARSPQAAAVELARSSR